MHQRVVDSGAGAAAGDEQRIRVETGDSSQQREKRSHEKGDEVAPGGAHLLQKFHSTPHYAKVGLGVAVVVALMLTSAVDRQSRISPLFSTGELSVVQAFAFIVCLSAIVAYIAFEGLAHFNRDPVVFKRLILSEESEAQLSATAEFAFYMLLFFFCDRTTLVPREKKKYDKDTFWFLWMCLVAAALATLQRARPPKPPPPPPQAANDGEALLPVVAPSPPPETFHVAHLQRDQTEEWKGWMQVMFLWYHYFEVKPIYNVIRLYIAAYVWMTGFGNFSYYYVRKDFSLPRFLQMQWRLNFMVIWVCAILSNEYMLYYICMLHTFFTLLIYAGLGLFPQYNTTTTGVTAKVLLLGLFCFVMWDISDTIFDTLWAPLTFLIQYHDPYDAARSVLSEWRFRSYLDHYIWIVGMLCAFNHPRIDAWLQEIDKLPVRTGNAVKWAVVAVCVGIGYWYVDNILLLPKKEYNRLHPYTSFIPILLFIVLRNISTRARMYHLHLFEFLGKTTLETYIAQFHIWMATTGVNGSPKRLLRVLPEGWPLVNFAVMSVVFFYVSYRLFQTTNVIKGAVLPQKASNAVLKTNTAVFAGVLVLAYCAALLVKIVA